MRERGRFITLEGGEGAGKSTQAQILADWLAGQGVSAVLTREPGGSAGAEALRELLLSGRVARFGGEAEALVFALARADHIETTIEPALAAGRWVISDRFFDSTWAYQGTAGVAHSRLEQLDRIAVGEHRPDLTVILDLPADLGLERLRHRKGVADRFEAESLDRHRARREAYLEIARREPERCVVVDASVEPGRVAEAIRNQVSLRLGAHLEQAD